MQNKLGQYPIRRMRRNRDGDAVRNMLAETSFSAHNLIWPLFVVDGKGQRLPIASMPGVERISIDLIPEYVSKALELNIAAIAIFPYVNQALKTSDCREALNPDNLVCRAVRAARTISKEIMIICDVALDPYNLDGHDGLYHEDSAGGTGRILNDETIEILIQQAIIQAQAGSDTLAPSDMMDGRIGKIREGLDAQNLHSVRLISYAAKYASGFYGPFRDAVGSTGLLKGDKRSYQMNPANREEALHEVALDLEEGADIVMVKPGMPYLDIIREVKSCFQVPVFAYQVSGEYTMLRLAFDSGYLDQDKVLMETMLSFRRAGASSVLTYFAPLIAKKLQAL